MMEFVDMINNFEWTSELFVEIVAAVALIGVLLVTIFKETHHSKYQTKMDYVRFYNDLDTKLRDTDRELREGNLDPIGIQHNMIQIIITVVHIIKFQDNMKVKFDMEYFRGWIRLGYAFTGYLKYFDSVDQDDQDIAHELICWCRSKTERKRWEFWKRKKKVKRWEKKKENELPISVRNLGKGEDVKDDYCDDVK